MKDLRRTVVARKGEEENNIRTRKGVKKNIEGGEERI